MLTKQLRNIARVLLLLYIGYYGCVSFFVHSHVYQGVVYVHSHPYNKLQKAENNDTDLPPFETHTHNAAGFFVLNQVSNTTSFEAVSYTSISVNIIGLVIPYNEKKIIEPASVALLYFNLRAPPHTSALFA